MYIQKKMKLRLYKEKIREIIDIARNEEIKEVEPQARELTQTSIRTPASSMGEQQEDVVVHSFSEDFTEESIGAQYSDINLDETY